MADTPAQEAAAGVMNDLLGELEEFTEQPESTDEASEESTDEQQQDETEVPEITWETPEELREVLEAPDFDEEEDDDEPVAQEQEFQFDDDDPEKIRMAKQLAKMQKKLAWAEEQKVKASRKAWADEARKYFQFSNPEVIQAKSRRAFLKEAQQQHAAVAKVAKPIFDQINQDKEQIREQIRAEERARAEKMWGRPTSGPTPAVNLEDTQTSARKRLEQGRNLTDVLKSKIKSGEVKL